DTGSVSASKSVQLQTDNPAILSQIDATGGAPKVDDIRDGTSNTIMMYEDVGRNDQMNGVNYDGSPFANDFYDPVTAGKRTGWRWADPDTSASIRFRINNGSGASMSFPDPNITDPTNPCYLKSWTVYDCGPYNEPFSFHGGGAHVIFADGHVTFMR